MKKRIYGVLIMRKEYDFSNSKKNPYTRLLKKQVTIRLGTEVINYFKELSRKLGIPYQNLINLYLKDCADAKKKPQLHWAH